MAATVGSILIKLGLDQARFQSGVKSARASANRFGREVQRDFKKLRRSVNDTGRAFGKMAAAAATVGAAGVLGAVTVSSFRSADALAKFADRIGTTTEGLRGLQLAAAETAGVGIAQTNMALQRMTRRVAEAAQGTGEAKDVIKELGLDAETLARQDPAETFAQIADAVRGVEDPAQQLRIAFKLFDSEGAALVTTLRQGSEGLEEYQKRAAALGIALSRVDAAKIEAANDALGRTRAAFEGLGNSMAVQVAPFVTAISQAFIDAAVEAGGFSQVTAKVFNGLMRGIGFVADMGRGLNVVFVGWQTAVAGAVSVITEGLALLAQQMNRVINFLAEKIASLNDALPDWLRPDWLQQTTDKLQGVNIAKPFEDAARTSQAAFEGAMAELKRLLSEPLPSEGVKQWAEGVQVEARKAAEAVAAAASGTSPGGGGGSEGEGEGDATNRADQLRQTIASSITDGAREGVDGMVSTFVSGLQSMASEMLQSQVINLLKGLGTGGAGGGAGGVFSAISGLLGFADGGSFRVGGAGGTDSQLVAFKASPDETVTVRRPDQMGGGQAVTLQNNISISGGATQRDAMMVERAVKQGQAQLLDELSRRGRI